jgi:hypothetical protein
MHQAGQKSRLLPLWDYELLENTVQLGLPVLPHSDAAK